MPIDGPTPCTEFDVRTLLAHLLANLDRVHAVGAGEPPFSVASFREVPEDRWVEEHRQATERVATVIADATMSLRTSLADIYHAVRTGSEHS